MLLGVPILSPDLCLAVEPLWLLIASGSRATAADRATMPMPGLGECSLALPGMLHADPAVPGRCMPPPPEERGLSVDLPGGIRGGARWDEEDDIDAL